MALSSDYFPLDKGAWWQYTDLRGMVPTSYVQQVTVGAHPATIRRRDGCSGPTDTDYIVGDRYIYLQKTEQRSLSCDGTYCPMRPLIKKQLISGDQWQWHGLLHPLIFRTKYKTTTPEPQKRKCMVTVGGQEQVTVRAGTFNAMKVTTIMFTENKRYEETVDWFADGVGLVKSKSASGPLSEFATRNQTGNQYPPHRLWTRTELSAYFIPKAGSPTVPAPKLTGPTCASF